MTGTLKKQISASESMVMLHTPCYIEKQCGKALLICATPLNEPKVADAKNYNTSLADFTLFLSAYKFHIEHLLL